MRGAGRGGLADSDASSMTDFAGYPDGGSGIEFGVCDVTQGSGELDPYGVDKLIRICAYSNAHSYAKIVPYIIPKATRPLVYQPNIRKMII